jgi:hypothetical protein
MGRLSALESHPLSPAHIKDGNFMKIKILDSKELATPMVDGLKFCEISDIAYDANDDIFYALSDKGNLFWLKIEIKKKTLLSVKILASKALRDKQGRVLRGDRGDSESLALVDDAILVSFERNPRILKYDKKLRYQKTLPLPQPLSHISSYRGKNDALEALTYSQKHGYIVTSEYPLKGQKGAYHDIYTSKGKRCGVKLLDKGHAITEMEMMPDGNLLLLLRKFTLRDFSFESALMKVSLDAKDGVCESEMLAWMSSKNGWKIDNFEGLTHLKDNLYLMISDDNNNPFEKTILTLFEIKE